MLAYFIASVWGFSEATFFFLIPDIYLTYIALSNPSKAIKACFLTAVAACLGGALMYCWGNSSANQAQAFLTWIPAIYPKLIDAVVKTTETHPFSALFIAPFKGIPYKIYAVILGEQKINFSKFIVISFFARLCRFLFITGIGIMMATFLKKKMSLAAIKYLHAAIWICIYGFYFGLTYLSYS